MESDLYTPDELPPGPLSGPPAVPLTAGEAPRLWLVRTSAHAEASGRAASDILDKEERARAAQFRHDIDRDCYIAAHVALRRLLGAYLGVEPADVKLNRAPCPMCQGPHGRPGVPGDPLHFSLSHSRELSLLGFAATPIGVDTEEIPGLDTVNELAGTLHPQEAAELSRLSPGGRPVAFARAWARKEAYLKGLGTGLARSPAEDYVGTGSLPPAAGPGGWALADVAVPGSHTAAVAVQR